MGLREEEVYGGDGVEREVWVKVLVVVCDLEVGV